MIATFLPPFIVVQCFCFSAFCFLYWNVDTFCNKFYRHYQNQSRTQKTRKKNNKKRTKNAFYIGFTYVMFSFFFPKQLLVRCGKTFCFPSVFFFFSAFFKSYSHFLQFGRMVGPAAIKVVFINKKTCVPQILGVLRQK